MAAPIGVLLDTHAVYWVTMGHPISRRASEVIIEAQSRRALFVSPISAWEIALASIKSKRGMNLDGRTASVWFRDARRALEARVAGVTTAVAQIAAEAPHWLQHGDPGDCFLVATAHARSFAFVTRDEKILQFAKGRPDLLTVVPC